jgi:ribose-phosphate pyrophosphokinase
MRETFNRGESVTSTYFANLISEFVDTLITIDPHLSKKLFVRNLQHTDHSLTILFQLDKINIDKPILIGPDESEQWVAEGRKKMLMPLCDFNES